jgi:hypothetical protein
MRQHRQQHAFETGGIAAHDRIECHKRRIFDTRIYVDEDSRSRPRETYTTFADERRTQRRKKRPASSWIHENEANRLDG